MRFEVPSGFSWHARDYTDGSGFAGRIKLICLIGERLVKASHCEETLVFQDVGKHFAIPGFIDL